VPDGLVPVRVVFVDRGDLGSWLIGYFSAGNLSHVDIELDESWGTFGLPAGVTSAAGYLLGARYDIVRPATPGYRGPPIRPGVQIRPPAYGTWRHRVVIEFMVTAAQRQAGWDFLRAQLGKPYDWRAILAFAFNRNWRNAQAWFCSELESRWTEVLGVVHPLFAAANKITPMTAATVASAVGREVSRELKRRWLFGAAAATRLGLTSSGAQTDVARSRMRSGTD